MTKDIKPLRKASSKRPPPQSSEEEPVKAKQVRQYSSLPSAPLPKVPSQLPQLDARTDQKLRRGQMEIEATLDLHGLTQEKAHARLNEFVLVAHRRGYRCILVITGKGRNGQGVLREKLPLWLSMEPLAGIILKTSVAIQRDGGEGAFYLYLKRTREIREQ